MSFLRKSLWKPMCAIVIAIVLISLITGCSNTSFIDHREGEPPSDGVYLAPVKIAYYWGYINQFGEMAIDVQFTMAKPFSENLALVAGDKGLGFIDKTGAQVISLKVQEAKSFSEGLASVKIDGKWGYIDTTGNIVIEPKYQKVESFSEGLACVKFRDKWGYIDTNGEYIVEPIYGMALPFSDGMAFVYPNFDGPDFDIKNAYIGTDGEVLFQPNLSGYNYDDFYEGYAVIYKPETMQYGYMDMDGEIVLEAEYDLAMPFREGMASIQDGNVIRFIDSSGNTVIENVNISYARSFTNGIAPVLVKDGWGFIDNQGKLLIDCEFMDVGSFSKVE